MDTLFRMKQPSILVSLGNNVRTRRTQAGLSQEQLGELSGLHRTYITHVEGATRNPSVASLYKIATALDCSISDLTKNIDK